MSVIDDTRDLANRELTGEGYVIAFHNERHVGPGDAYYRTLFVHPVQGRPGEIIGGSLREATLYPTYQAAAIAASGWSHTRGQSTRIIHIKRVCPYVVMEDYPSNIVDAVVEAL